MKITIFLLLYLSVFSFLLGAEQPAVLNASQEIAPSVQAPRFLYTQRLGNDYISKGMRTSPRARTQSTAEFSWYGFYLNLWSNWDLTGYAKDPNGKPYHYDSVEWDYTVGYRFPIASDLPVLEDLKGAVSYCYAEIPRNSSGDSENYAIQLSATCFLKPLVKLHWYPDGPDQFRLRFGISHDIPLHASYKWKNNLTLWTGNSRLLGSACPGGWRVARERHSRGERGGDTYKTGVYSLVYTLEIEWKVRENITIAPFFQAGWAPDHDIREGWEDRKAANAINFGYGITLGFRL